MTSMIYPKANKSIFSYILLFLFIFLSIFNNHTETVEARYDEKNIEDYSPTDVEIDYHEETVSLVDTWEFAGYSKIHTGNAKLYFATKNNKKITIAINAGHGTKGGSSTYTLCHPDGSSKVTGGTTAKGATESYAVSEGMTFTDGTAEKDVTLETAKILKDLLLSNGYNVLMLRDSDDVQLDNIARTVISNNCADCMISLHWDSDGLNYDKGCFYISVPTELKTMYPVNQNWVSHENLGQALINAISEDGLKLYNNGKCPIDLTQMSYSTIPSVDIELGNQLSDHSNEALTIIANSLLTGINNYWN